MSNQIIKNFLKNEANTILPTQKRVNNEKIKVNKIIKKNKNYELKQKKLQKYKESKFRVKKAVMDKLKKYI